MEAALAALVNCNSFTGNPEGGRAVANRLDALLEIEGVTMEAVSSSTYADHRIYRTTGSPALAPVAFIGHFDTVFPPGTFEGYRRDGVRGCGPGTLDMKGGLVIASFALRALAQHSALGAVPSVVFVVVSDEEVGSPEGAAILGKATTQCSAALVFEAGREGDAIVTMRRGTGVVSATAHGKPAHAGNAYWEGVNAIWVVAQFVDLAQRLASRAEATTVNAGLIAGGTSKNTVPAEAVVQLDLRYPTFAARDALFKSLAEAAAAASAAVPGSRIDLDFGPARPPMQKVAGADALLASYAACAAHFGLGSAEAPIQGGGSDGNTVAALGIPTIDGLGPRGAGFHTPDEFIELPSLLLRAQALTAWLLSRDTSISGLG